MKTIGLIGGTSWVSTVDYYRLINQFTNHHLGGINSAEILLYSVNYHEFKLQVDDSNLQQITNELIRIAQLLQQGGADCILLGANTMHIMAEQVQPVIDIPLLHIADVTARAIAAKKISKVGLLGTKFTMERDFFKERLKAFGIEAMIPAATERDFIHDSIFNELGNGVLLPQTKARYLEIIDDLIAQGAEGIIFGCTEIPLLIPPAECSFIVFDTLEIHAKSAVDFALGLR